MKTTDKIRNDEETPIVYFPKSSLEVTRMADALMLGKTIIINLSELESLERFRVLDFISGLAYSIRAQRDLLDKGVYIFSPPKK